MMKYYDLNFVTIMNPRYATDKKNKQEPVKHNTTDWHNC